MTRILIVDDILQNRYMLEALLKGNGFEVTSTGNGAEALAEAIRDPPELIIADILMPVMDGYELCREWKADDRLRSIPFIFYTGTYTDPKDEKFALKLGAERFVIKPQKPEVLLDLIQEVLEEARGKAIDHYKKPIGSDAEILQEYNEVLYRKLVKKVKQLEIEIGEHKATELALRESEERFKKAFECGVIGMAILSPEMRFTQINKEFCRMLGYPEDELLKMGPFEITHPEYRQTDIENIRRLKAGEIPVYVTEKRYYKKDGSTIWSVTMMSTLYDKEGRPPLLLVVAHDITKQKIMQEHERRALEQIEKNLEQLATLNDQIRNPLSIIIALMTLEEKTKTTEKIIEAVRSIDDIVRRLDEGWAESAKVREFLERNNQISRRLSG